MPAASCFTSISMLGGKIDWLCASCPLLILRQAFLAHVARNVKVMMIYWSIQLNQLELPDNDPATRSLFFSVHGLRRCNSPEGREVSGPEQVKQPHLPRFGA